MHPSLAMPRYERPQTSPDEWMHGFALRLRAYNVGMSGYIPIALVIMP